MDNHHLIIGRKDNVASCQTLLNPINESRTDLLTVCDQSDLGSRAQASAEWLIGFICRQELLQQLKNAKQHGRSRSDRSECCLKDV